MTEKRTFETYEDFWPYYLDQHRSPWTKRIHALGLGAGMAMLIFALFKGLLWLFAVPVVAYGIVWTSHFFIERNRPATWGHFWWSLRSEFRMVFQWATGRLK